MSHPPPGNGDGAGRGLHPASAAPITNNLQITTARQTAKTTASAVVDRSPTPAAAASTAAARRPRAARPIAWALSADAPNVGRKSWAFRVHCPVPGHGVHHHRGQAPTGEGFLRRAPCGFGRYLIVVPIDVLGGGA